MIYQVGNRVKIISNNNDSNFGKTFKIQDITPAQQYIRVNYRYYHSSEIELTISASQYLQERNKNVR